MDAALHRGAGRDPPHPARAAAQTLRPRRGQGRRPHRRRTRPRAVAAPRRAARPAGPRPRRGVRRRRLQPRPNSPWPARRPAGLLAPSPLLATAVLCRPPDRRPRHRRPARRAAPAHRRRQADRALAVPGAGPRHRPRPHRRAHRRALGGRRPGGRGPGPRRRAAAGGCTGRSRQVLDGHSAGLLLVAAHTGGFARSRTLLFLVRADAPGLVAHPADRPRRDPPAGPRSNCGTYRGRVAGRRTAADVPRRPSPPPGDTAAAVLAAEAVGAADAGARPDRRVRTPARAVRPADRLLPGGQAPARRPVRPGAGGPLGGLLRGLGTATDERRRSPSPRPWRPCATAAGEGDPAARRHRLHLGARGAPVLQAGRGRRAAVRPGAPAAGARGRGRAGCSTGSTPEEVAV